MTTEQLEQIEELERRAVACKQWRWMPGMRYCTKRQAYRLTEDHFLGGLSLIADCLPDLRDPATLGCLLALVREALDPRVWGSPLCLAKTKEGWELGYFLNGDWFTPLDTCDTEAEALVAALEVAP